MKRCPQCNRIETDESLKFCRADGVMLVSDSSSFNSEAGTAQLGSSPDASEVHTSILPNNTVVNTTIENLAARVMRRQRFFLQITYDTDREKVEEFAARIEQLLVEHPVTNKGTIRVRFNEFGESSLNILVYFYLEVRDITTELKEREDILFQIMEIARKLGVEFAFPTRTLQVVAATAPVEFEGARAAAR